MKHPVELFMEPPETRDPLAIATAFREACNSMVGVTNRKTAELLGLTEATMSNWMGLLRLHPQLTDKGLMFKAARELARIVPKSRQLEVAPPLYDGSLSTVYAEEYCKIAKENPKWGVDDILMELGRDPVAQKVERPVDLSERAGGVYNCKKCGGQVMFDGEEDKCFMCSWRPAA